VRRVEMPDFWNPYKIDTIIQYGTMAARSLRDERICEMTVSAFSRKTPKVKKVVSEAKTLCAAFVDVVKRWLDDEGSGNYLLKVDDDCIPCNDFWVNLHLEDSVMRLLTLSDNMVVSLLRTPWIGDRGRFDTTAVIASRNVWSMFVTWSKNALSKHNNIEDNTTRFFAKFLNDCKLFRQYTNRSLIQLRPHAGTVLDCLNNEKFARDFNYTGKNPYLSTIKSHLSDIRAMSDLYQVSICGACIASLLNYSGRLTSDNPSLHVVCNMKTEEDRNKLADVIRGALKSIFYVDVAVHVMGIGNPNAGGYDMAVLNGLESYENHVEAICNCFNDGLFDGAPVVLFARTVGGMSFIEDMEMLGATIWYNTSREMIAGIRRKVFGL
jgi:hypothetical protein